jgi:hypothetical protein
MRKYAFLESVFEGEEEKGYFNLDSGQAHHGARIQAHPECNQVKAGLRGAGPGACVLGARPCPRATDLAPLSPADSN